MRKIRIRKRKGAVLVEILVVVVILGLLTLLEIPHVPIGTGKGEYVRARHPAVVAQIRSIENALDIYFKHNGLYPTTEQGLEALVNKPATDPQPENYFEGGYMRRVPLDPWRNPFIYRRHGEEGPIDIVSCGPDGEEWTDDDITNHNSP